jgi:hypothetical protein
MLDTCYDGKLLPVNAALDRAPVNPRPPVIPVPDSEDAMTPPYCLNCATFLETAGSLPDTVAPLD